MPFENYHKMSTIERLFLLRSIAITIQLITVLVVYFVMSLHLNLLPLICVIIVETLFHGVSIFVYRQRQARNIAVLCQIVADVFFLTILLSFSGGATNAFVSLLLLPIVIAAVSLPPRYLFFISLSAITSYSLLLLTMPKHTMHHMDMTNHFIGMWANFLLSVVVVSIVVGMMSRVIINREQAIAIQREAQLKNEQLLALGIAATQVTHQLATPLANIQLLYEELIEDYPEHEALLAMALPLKQCSNQLGYFRHLATSIRENKQDVINVNELQEQLLDQAHFHFPEQDISLLANTHCKAQILCDAMLLPALLNLLQNAIRANQEVNQTKITLEFKLCDNELQITLRDFGKGIEASMAKEQRDLLGDRLVASQSGLGMAVFLSNATFQRLGGKLTLKNHPKKGCIAQVCLPLIQSTT